MTPLDTPPGGRLTDLFARWRADIASVPMPRLVDAATAVAVVRAAQHRVELERGEAPPADDEVTKR